MLFVLLVISDGINTIRYSLVEQRETLGISCVFSFFFFCFCWQDEIAWNPFINFIFAITTKIYFIQCSLMLVSLLPRSSYCRPFFRLRIFPFLFFLMFENSFRCQAAIRMCDKNGINSRKNNKLRCELWKLEIISMAMWMTTETSSNARKKEEQEKKITRPTMALFKEFEIETKFII